MGAPVWEVVCFGEVLWDMLEARPGGGELVARFFRRELGGESANVATGLARLGVRVGLVAGVGRDRLGQALVAHLAADAVDVRFVQTFAERTGITFVARGPRGEPQFMPYRDKSADGALRAEHLTPAAGKARWVVVGTSPLAATDLAAAAERFLAYASAAGARLAVDLNVRPHLWENLHKMRRAAGDLAARAALVKASQADLRALGARASGLAWLERHAPGATWIVTRGPREASAIGEHGEAHAPAMRRLCVDATGAGDAFLAGVLATIVAAGAVPSAAGPVGDRRLDEPSSAWRDAELWGMALRAGHIMGKKAISRPGAVAGLVRLGAAAALVEAARRRFA